MNSNIPAILITGTVGKTVTIKYISHILYNFYKFKTLYFELNEENNIEKVLINGLEKIEIQSYRNGIDSILLEGLSPEEKECFLINEIAKDNEVEVIISKNTNLNIYLNVVVCGVTNIDYDRSMDIEQNLSHIFRHYILRNNVPLVTCPQSKVIMPEIFNICKAGSIPLFKAPFYHLKYINYETGIKARYSYINLALALIICKIFLNNFDFKIFKPYDINNYKKIESTCGHIYNCSYLYPLPRVKDIDFKEYSKVYTVSDIPNINLYLETAGTFKSTNLLINQFNRYIESKKLRTKSTIVPIIFFSCLPQNELFLTLLPLTTYEFLHFYIIDYKMKGYEFDKLLGVFEDPSNIYNLKKYSQNEDWSKTMYEAITYIYNEDSMTEQRLKSLSPLNEYYGLEENIKLCHLKNLPVTPNITLDTLPYIKKWISRLAKKYSSIEYHILCTGCKKLINDIFENFEF